MKERKSFVSSRYFQIFPPTYIPHAENALIKSSHDEGTKERKDYALRGSEKMKGKKFLGFYVFMTEILYADVVALLNMVESSIHDCDLAVDMKMALLTSPRYVRNVLHVGLWISCFVCLQKSLQFRTVGNIR